MPDSPTRLTSEGPTARPTHSLTDSPSENDASGEDGSAPSVSKEASRLLDGADGVIEQLDGLIQALRQLESETRGKSKESAQSLRQRASDLVSSLRDLKESVRQEGATRANKGSLQDFSDVAGRLAQRARNVRAAAPMATGEGLSEHTSEHEEEESGAGGGTATAVMFLGGAALTAWIISRGSGQAGSGSDNGVLPASGALLGQ